MGYFKLIWLYERREEVINHIREKETERIYTDIFNVKKCQPLYDVLEKIDMAILEEKQMLEKEE